MYDRYGPPEVLRLEVLPRPGPGPHEVLVEVAAVSVNLADWECLTGSPAYARYSGLRRPGNRVLGSDIAGRVAAVGSAVSRFAVGEEVYGEAPMGGFAEYAVAKASMVSHKPSGLTFVQASTLPQAGAIASQGVARTRPGSRVLINGAGGGTGMFAIQLAKIAGAHVTGVDNTHKLASMRSLGADEVVDYHRADFTRLAPCDVVLDLVAHRSVFAFRRVLAPGGRYLVVGGPTTTLLRTATAGTLLGLTSGRRIGVLVVKTGPAHYADLAARCAAGQVEIRIDRTVGLDGVPGALGLVGTGRALGKVVVEP